MNIYVCITGTSYKKVSGVSFPGYNEWIDFKYTGFEGPVGVGFFSLYRLNEGYSTTH